MKTIHPNIKYKLQGACALCVLVLNTSAGFAQGGGLPSQDSMIPPEVLPASSQQDMPPAAPGLATPGAGPETAYSGMQTAQQARAAALNQLMGNRQWTPEMSAQLNDQLQSSHQYANYGQNGPVVADSAQQAGAPEQTQLLTGGVKYNQPIYNTQRSGASNAGSAGLGLLSAMARPGRLFYPLSLGGFAALGIGATGFGVRNGFRL